MNRRCTPSRTANVLVATLIVLAGVGSIVALSSDRLVGTRTLQSANLAKQQASYAAEAMASLVETKLVVSSGDLNNLTSDVVETDTSGNKTIGQRWLAQGLYHNGSLTTKGMWLGNCLVYWRIEPVKIYSQTISDKNQDGLFQGSEIPSASEYSDNYQANPNEVVTPNTTFTGTSKNGDNPGYYHFRIVTQAYYVNQAEWGKQNLTMNTVNPWERPEHTISSAQAQRLVQLKLVNLFRYVLFYGAKKETGDIELNPGANLDIVGAVHSNGAIYLGGQGTGYLDGNYSYAATSTANITVGSADKQVTVTGVDGIFRTRKVGNYHYQDKYNPTPSVQDPYQIDVADKNLNGPVDSRVKLNNVDLTPKNDSRSGLSGHTAKVRDRNLGAGEVNTLANIPQLSGYPFEPQAVVGQGVPLFRTANGTGGFTIRPNDHDLATIKQLYYNDSFTGITTTPKAGHEVYATDLPLITYHRGSNIVNDVAFNASLTTKDDFDNVDPSNTALKLFGDPDAGTERKNTFLLHLEDQKAVQDNAKEARGYYLQMSLFGQPSSNRTGLTIRERGAQNTAWTMYDKSGEKKSGIVTRPTLSDYDGSVSDYVKAMSLYMARNYVVYFGLENGVPVDVTAFFFGLEKNVSGDMVGTYETESQLPAIEGGFVNRREANSYRLMGYLTDASTYKNDVLSLNIGRIQQLIKDNNYIKFNPSTTLDDDTPSSVIFNGLIYAHRTPRLGKTDKGTPIFDPRAPLRYHPLVSTKDDTAAGIYGFTGGLYPMIGSVKEGKMNTSSSILYRNGDPLMSIWSVFPSLKQVRVFNGSEINWGATQKSGRLQGLTVVTPNHCYIQGDYNTKVDPVKTAKGADQYPPCGIYADGMTMLTNLWKDENGAHDTTPAGNTTTYNVSVVTNNIPTDYENAWDEGSGGTHNLLRFLENGGRNFNFFGSIVVLNRMRYARNYLGAKAGWYGAPNRVLKFNQDLLTAEGQPPFSPWGMQVTRVLSSVNTTNR